MLLPSSMNCIPHIPYTLILQLCTDICSMESTDVESTDSDWLSAHIHNGGNVTIEKGRFAI